MTFSNSQFRFFKGFLALLIYGLSLGSLIILLGVGAANFGWEPLFGGQVASASPTQAQWRVGIDCGCAKDGRYVAPDAGSNIDLSQSSSSVQEGLSPHGKYRLVAEPAVVLPGESVSLSICAWAPSGAPSRNFPFKRCSASCAKSDRVASNAA